MIIALIAASLDGYLERWIESKHKSDFGPFKLTAGNFYGDEEKDKGLQACISFMCKVFNFNCCNSVGLQTSENARFYAMSSKFNSFSNRGKTVVIQFTVKHEQGIDCGGGYVKVRYNEVE